jgi:hypothetical protein
MFNHFAPRGIPGASFFLDATFIGIGLLLLLYTFSKFPQVFVAPKNAFVRQEQS